MDRFKPTLLSAFILLNKNWSVYLVSYLLLVYPQVYSSLIGRSTLLSVLSMAVGIAWLGTETALLRDSQQTGYTDWTRLKLYLWKYFKKFSPLMLIYILLGVFSMILGTVLWVKYANSHNIDVSSTEALSTIIKQLSLQFQTESSGIKGWLLSLPLLLLFPFTVSFAPIVVIRDISFFQGIPKTLRLLLKHKQLYLSIFSLALINSLLFRLLSLLAIPMTALSTIFFYQVIFGLLSTYSNLLITAFVIVYLTKNSLVPSPGAI